MQYFYKFRVFLPNCVPPAALGWLGMAPSLLFPSRPNYNLTKLQDFNTLRKREITWKKKADLTPPGVIGTLSCSWCVRRTKVNIPKSRNLKLLQSTADDLYKAFSICNLCQSNSICIIFIKLLKTSAVYCPFFSIPR